jgi:hypothetical protein
MRFLADNGSSGDARPVSMNEDDDGRRLVDIERESEVTSGGLSDRGGSGAQTQKAYKIEGRLVRVNDLIEAGLISADVEIELATRDAPSELCQLISSVPVRGVAHLRLSSGMRVWLSSITIAASR